MKSLIIINDAPYGTERFYNALRLGQALLDQKGAQLDLFLMADAVHGARLGQKPPEGFYNIELMLRRIIRANGRVMLCGTCSKARALSSEEIVAGARISTMSELAEAVAASDRVLVY